jgi:spermidine synthase
MDGKAMKKILQILRRKSLDVSKMRALEPFAKDGGWQTWAYADSVKTLDAWEIDPQYKKILKKKFPQAKVKITDSIQEFKKRNHFGKYDFIVIDNPMNCFGRKEEYCEHFNLVPAISRLLDEEGILIFNVNKCPYNYKNNLKMKQRREEYYGRKRTNKIAMSFFLRFYQKLFKDFGYKTKFSFSVSRGKYDQNDYFHYLVFYLQKNEK